MKQLFFFIILLCGPIAARAQWESSSNGFSAVSAGCFTDVTEGILVGTSNGVYRSDDIGLSWTPFGQGFLTSDSIIFSFGRGTERLFAGTAIGIYGSDDDGQTWNLTHNVGNKVTGFSNIGGDVFASTDGSGVLVSSNNGDSWAQTSGTLPNVVWTVIGKGGYLFAGTNNGAFRSTDLAQTWIPILGGGDSLRVREIVTDGVKLYMGSYEWGGAGHTLRESTDDGLNWNVLSSLAFPGGSHPVAASLLCMQSSVLIGGERIYLSTDQGANWVNFTSGYDPVGGHGITCFHETADHILVGNWGGDVGPVHRIAKEQALDIYERSGSERIILNPNPTTGLLRFEERTGGAFTLTDLTGRTLMQGTAPAGQNTLDITALPEGIYLLRLHNGATARVVKVRE
ncbi:MAG: T9SS type A sorting domain-containing protein [Flavobacteriales bacterium]|nr:T9SS type A sorting domain-containing protein [Flavobacteriales bacterium]